MCGAAAARAAEVSGRHRLGTGAAARRVVALVVSVGALLATGVLALGADQPGVSAEPRPAGAATPAAPGTPPPTWKVLPANPEPATARPTRLRIPAIGVNSRIVTIGVDRTGALIPPATTDVTGWFAAGPVPGAIGPALLAAHVDSRAGPGVFFRLTDLRPGDVVIVDRADHTSTRFVVDSSTRVAKTTFPTELIYSPKPVAMLRLVTCGGSFDSQKRSYLDNVIVNATIR
jgi:sortase (surface protein transpeptidase)